MRPGNIVKSLVREIFLTDESKESSLDYLRLEKKHGQIDHHLLPFISKLNRIKGVVVLQGCSGHWPSHPTGYVSLLMSKEMYGKFIDPGNMCNMVYKTRNRMDIRVFFDIPNAYAIKRSIQILFHYHSRTRVIDVVISSLREYAKEINDSEKAKT